MQMCELQNIFASSDFSKQVWIKIISCMDVKTNQCVNPKSLTI